MQRTLIIDGDFTAYLCALDGEKKQIDWGDDVITGKPDEKRACRSLDSCVEQYIKRLKADAVVFALSDPTRRYWRHDVYPLYKHQRTHKEPPVLLPQVRDHIEQGYKTYIRPRMEADDVVGILATNPHLYPGEKIIVSADKDLLTIPGLHWNPRKPHEEVVNVREEDADFNHLFQTLTGDTCDGFPGCPGVGPVKATKILDGFGLLWPEHVWEPVVTAFTDRKKTEADALVQAQIARICRATDYDYTKKEVRLWTPYSNRSPRSPG